MSGHLALVVDRAGATLETGTHDTLVLTHADGRRERIGLRALGSVLLHGDVLLSTGVLHALAAHGVPFTTLPMRGRAPAVGVAHLPHRHVRRRHQQHLAYADPEQRLELARRVVCAKLESMAECARQQIPEMEDAFYRAMHTASQAPDFAALMGVEGAATVKHFGALETRYAHTGTFAFHGRSRRPPRDPVNALMSLAYTLAQGQATPLAVKAGLDVQIGFLHALHPDRESLALDLLEPARAVLDDWVHDLLVRQARLKPAQFTHSPTEGVRLDAEGRAAFYAAWFREGHRLALKPMQRLLAQLLEALGEAGPDDAHPQDFSEAA
jgi:CRISPR-associated protein Cas1